MILANLNFEGGLKKQGSVKLFLGNNMDRYCGQLKYSRTIFHMRTVYN